MLAVAAGGLQLGAARQQMLQQGLAGQGRPVAGGIGRFGPGHLDALLARPGLLFFLVLFPGFLLGGGFLLRSGVRRRSFLRRHGRFGRSLRRLFGGGSFLIHRFFRAVFRASGAAAAGSGACSGRALPRRRPSRQALRQLGERVAARPYRSRAGTPGGVRRRRYGGGGGSGLPLALLPAAAGTAAGLAGGAFLVAMMKAPWDQISSLVICWAIMRSCALTAVSLLAGLSRV